MGKKLYSLMMFVMVSILAGLMTAGLAIPAIGVASDTIKIGVDSLESLPSDLEIPAQSEKTRVLLADGSLLTNFYDENRIYVPLSDISPLMQKAQIAIEDHRFYEHGALDLQGTLRALLSTLRGHTQGGSTLTQQYVKLVLLEKALQKGDLEAARAAVSQNIGRKIRELRYAVALEKKLSKDQILERYLNIAYYGDGAYGVESAAHHYFGTTAKDLTLAQAAMLAGIVQNPSTNNPVANPRAAIKRRNLVLQRMADLGIVSQAEAKKAAKEPFDLSKVTYSQGGCAAAKYPFVCSYVEHVLLKSPELGNTVEARKALLYRGGLTITTTIDPRIQDAAQKSISSMVAPKDPVISVIVTVQPGTGHIMAMAQSRPKMGNGPGETFLNYAVSRDMGGANGFQAGSTFKAYTLAAAFSKGIPPTRRYNSPPTMDFTNQIFTSCNGPFKSGKFLIHNALGSGNFNAYQGTNNSANTFFVQLERDTGMCEVTTLAKNLGVKIANDKDIVKEFEYRPSFTLGTVETTPLSNAAAYATFAARGKYCPPTIISKIVTSDGKEISLPKDQCRQVIDPNVADTVNQVLRGPINQAFARSANVGPAYDQAAKTGTTDDFRDLWIIGYTPQLATAAMLSVDGVDPFWKGVKDPSLLNLRLPYSKYFIVGSSGGDTGRLWREEMKVALPLFPATRFVKPEKEIVGRLTPVQNCAGMSLAVCTKLLNDAHFGTVVVKKFSDSVPKGTVMSSSPLGNAPEWSNITLTVSDGPNPSPSPSPSASASDAPGIDVTSPTTAPRPTPTPRRRP